MTAPGNGRAHFQLARGCVMVQPIEPLVEAGDAYSLVIDASLVEGEAATLVAALVTIDGSGERSRVAERRFSLKAGTGGWQSHQLLTGFDDLTAHAGARLAIAFEAPLGNVGVVGLDAVELTRHRDDVASGPRFSNDWSGGCDERWIGEHHFANRLRDWAVHEGRLTTREPASHRPLRTAHRITTAVSTAPSDFSLRVDTGTRANRDAGRGRGGWSGFLIGAGYRLDHRGAALIHNRAGRNGGLIAGIDAAGRAFLADNGVRPHRRAEGRPSDASSPSGATLQLDARYAGEGFTR